MLAKRWVLAVAIPSFVARAIMAFLPIGFAAGERTEPGIHTCQVIDRLQKLLSNMQGAADGWRGYIARAPS